MTDEQKLEAVRTYVRDERQRRGIVASCTDFRPEHSCVMNGEFYHLVEVQLMYTVEGHGGWLSLKHPKILEGAYLYVTEGKRG